MELADQRRLAASVRADQRGDALVRDRESRHRQHRPLFAERELEVEAQKRVDPLALLRNELERKGLSSELDGIDQAIQAEIEDAVRFAEESPEPPPDLLEATTYKGAFAR